MTFACWYADGGEERLVFGDTARDAAETFAEDVYRNGETFDHLPVCVRSGERVLTFFVYAEISHRFTARLKTQ